MNRKIIFLGLTLLVVLLSLSPAFAFTNLFSNPSCEEANDWDSWGENAACNFKWEDTIAHTGTRSLSISNFSGEGTGIWGKGVNVEPNKSYILSVWVKAENLTKGSVYLFCYENGENQVTFSPSITSTTDNWQQLTIAFVFPKNTTAISFQLRANGVNPEAKVYFDDVAVFEIPQNSLWLESGVHNDGIEGRITHEGATGGNMYYQPAGSPTYAWMTFTLPTGFPGLPPGVYKYKIRLFGDPKNNSQQEFYSSIVQPIKELPSFTDGKFHYVEGTFTIDGERYFENAIVKKTGEQKKGTNPIDWIWICPANMDPIDAEISILEPPGNLSAQYVGPGKARLTWTAPASRSGIAVYQVYRGLAPNFNLKDGKVVTSTTECFYEENLDQSHEIYYYKVIAWNNIYGGFGSPYSNEVAVKSDNIPPLAPENVTAQAQDNGLVFISWSPSAIAIDGDLPVSYWIYRMVEGQPDTITLLKKLTAEDSEFGDCLWFDRGMATGSYSYLIKAIDKAGLESEGTNSNVISVISDNILPEAPASLQAFTDKTPNTQEEIPGGTVYLFWSKEPLASDGDPASFYRIYRSQKDNPRQTGKIIAQILASADEMNQVVDQTVIGGIKYYYAVTSLDKALNESRETSPTAIAVPTEAPKPFALKPLDSIPVQVKPVLAWSRVSPIADKLLEYQVEVAQDSNFSKNKQLFSVEGTEAEEQTLQVEIPLVQGLWYWRVKACFCSGVESAYSNIGTFVILDFGNDGVPLGLYANLSPRIFSARNGEATTLFVQSGQAAAISATVYGLHGEYIYDLVKNSTLTPTEILELHWQGEDARGRKVANGIYFILIEAQTLESKYKQIKKVQVHN